MLEEVDLDVIFDDQENEGEEEEETFEKETAGGDKCAETQEADSKPLISYIHSSEPAISLICPCLQPNMHLVFRISQVLSGRHTADHVLVSIWYALGDKYNQNIIYELPLLDLVLLHKVCIDFLTCLMVRLLY